MRGAIAGAVPPGDLDARDTNYIRETLSGLWLLASRYFRADVDSLHHVPPEHPDHPAIKLDDLVLNYRLLDEATARAAGLLRSKGVDEGDRVGMQLPNVPYFPTVYFGALRLGAVVVPMNPLLKEREVAHHLSDSGASLILGWHSSASPAPPALRRPGRDACW